MAATAATLTAKMGIRRTEASYVPQKEEKVSFPMAAPHLNQLSP